MGNKNFRSQNHKRDFRGNDRRGGGDRPRGGFAQKRDRLVSRSRMSVQEAYRSRDMVLGGVTKTIDDLDKIINLLGERLEDWYGTYFPELKIDEKAKFAEAVLKINREDLKEEDLVPILGQKRAGEVVVSAKNTIGALLSARDLSECHALAREIISLDKLRAQYDKYQKEMTMELCPNITQIAGSEVAAKLISHVGSLKKLAFLPSSTIQVIGAEKSLFKHLKNRNIPPPKHGIIFQFPKISSSPKMVRGKIARLLSNQICLAAKADAFTKREIWKELKKKFDDHFKKIMDDYDKQKKARLKDQEGKSNMQEKENAYDKNLD